MMKVLVIGSGGREHALVWKLAQSPRVSQVYCAPGNDGIGRMAELVAISVDDIDGLVAWAKQEQIGLTVVGPEVPLTLGIVDRFEEAGLRIFGPTQQAAQLEGSKSFAKDLMQKYGIPTAKYQTFTDPEQAKDYIRQEGVPVVVKADGLAAGKGVVVAQEMEEALLAVDQLLDSDQDGQIVIEEFLEGVEISILAVTDGKSIFSLAPAHDHKAVYNGGEGPNTGGMGAFSPTHLPNGDKLLDQVAIEILEPTLAALQGEGIQYKGVIFAGLMLTDQGPKVLEYNARFGDPETQVVLPLLENDLFDLLNKIIDEELDQVELRWKDQKALAVILASGGYPGNYEKGMQIYGLDRDGQLEHEKVLIFHAGTRYHDGHWLTNGGRVIAITALGADFSEAKINAYQAVEQVTFSGQHYRTDIGDQTLD